MSAGRRQFYLASVGATVGALLTGLLLPFLIGPSDLEVAAGGPAAGQTADHSEVDGGRTTDGAVGPERGADPDGMESTAGDNTTGSPGGRPGSGTTGSATAERPPPGGEVRIGVLVADTGAVAAIGLSTTTPEQNEAWWRAAFDIVNERDLAGGRKLVPIIEYFDSLDSSQQDHVRACEALANDAKVFAVVAQSGYTGNPVLCLADRYRLPTLLIEGETSHFFERASGRLFSKNATTERAGRETVTMTHARGILRDRTIGAVVTQTPGDTRAWSDGVAPRLEELGYETAAVSQLSQDLGTTQSQIPVEVARQRAAGVDLVFLATDPVRITLWTQEADAQGFRPRYVVFDLNSATSDFTAENAPDSFEGFGVTASQQGWDLVGPEPEPERDCREAITAQGGEPVPEKGTAGFRNATVYCGMVQLLARGIAAAGADLTPEALVAGLEAVGPFAVPDVGPASFRPDKHDGADGFRLLRADMQRRRWVPQGPFERPG